MLNIFIQFTDNICFADAYFFLQLIPSHSIKQNVYWAGILGIKN